MNAWSLCSKRIQIWTAVVTRQEDSHAICLYQAWDPSEKRLVYNQDIKLTGERKMMFIKLNAASGIWDAMVSPKLPVLFKYSEIHWYPRPSVSSSDIQVKTNFEFRPRLFGVNNPFMWGQNTQLKRNFDWEILHVFYMIHRIGNVGRGVDVIHAEI